MPIVVLENAMKISPTFDPVNSVNQANASQKAGQAVSAAVSATNSAAQSLRSASVSVTVSTQARGLEQASRSDVADIDAQKVAAVKASIKDGTYTVNAEAIADKLLSNAQDMVSRASR